jgi:hypothetical protein
MEYNRPMTCCAKDTSLSYIAGVHFTAEDIFTFDVKKRVKGRALWAMGSVLCLIKALSMVPKLGFNKILINLDYLWRYLA